MWVMQIPTRAWVKFITTVPRGWQRQFLAHTAATPCTKWICYAMVPWASSQKFQTCVWTLWWFSLSFRCFFNPNPKHFQTQKVTETSPRNRGSQLCNYTPILFWPEASSSFGCLYRQEGAYNKHTDIVTYRLNREDRMGVIIDEEGENKFERENISSCCG